MMSGTKVEIKNLNPVCHIVKVIEFERQRQAKIIDSDELFCQVTKL